MCGARAVSFSDADREVALEYTDRPGHSLHITSTLKSPALDPKGVPALLFGLTAEYGVLVEAETEILAVRDELYHRINSTILRQALTIPGSEISTESEFGIYSNQNAGRHNGQKEQAFEVALDNAVAAVRHLGIKSEENYRLFHTALYMHALRQAYHRGNADRVMTLLGLIDGLKRNNRFDIVATKEIEFIFRSLCSASITTEVTEILEDGLLGEDSVENEMKLKRSIRKAFSVDVLTDETTKLLTICDIIVAIHEAMRSCVHERVTQVLLKANRLTFDTSSAAVSTL